MAINFFNMITGEVTVTEEDLIKVAGNINADILDYCRNAPELKEFYTHGAINTLKGAKAVLSEDGNYWEFSYLIKDKQGYESLHIKLPLNEWQQVKRVTNFLLNN